MTDRLLNPYVYFGNKRSVAPAVWHRIGNPRTLIIPFAGSMSELLARPVLNPTDQEIVNDLHGLLVNFWRAVRADPHAVASHAHRPPMEVEMHAVGDYLYHGDDAMALPEKLRDDLNYHDARMAGLWVWFMALWIGNEPNAGGRGKRASRGQVMRQKVSIRRNGIWRNSTAGNLAALQDYFTLLSNRMSRVTVMCGDWTRALANVMLHDRPPTAVLLDPPYAKTGRQSKVYHHDSDGDISSRVRQWALDHGDDPSLRIVLYGYSHEHDDHMPPEWARLSWKANGGFSNQARQSRKDNPNRETVWFSPHCLNPEPEALPNLPLLDYEVGRRKT